MSIENIKQMIHADNELNYLKILNKNKNMEHLEFELLEFVIESGCYFPSRIDVSFNFTQDGIDQTFTRTKIVSRELISDILRNTSVDMWRYTIETFDHEDGLIEVNNMYSIREFFTHAQMFSADEFNRKTYETIHDLQSSDFAYDLAEAMISVIPDKVMSIEDYNEQ